MGFGRFGVLTERLRPLRNAAACCKSTRSLAPGPGGIGGHASWLLGPRSRSDARGFELAPGGVRDGNYAHFPAPAPELSPAPGPRTLVLLASRVLGPGSAHLSRPRMKPAAGGFLRLASSRPGDGKRADSGTRRLEDDDAARAERLGHVRQVCHEELDLPARSSRRPTSEENHGRRGLAAHCQEGPEVGVRRDDDAAFPCRALENHDVVGLLESVVADMDRIVSSVSQANRHDRGQALSIRNLTDPARAGSLALGPRPPHTAALPECPRA